MKILLRKAGDIDYRKIIEMKDLEEVIKFMDEIGEDLILFRVKDKKDYELEIMIYDNYIE